MQRVRILFCFFMLLNSIASFSQDSKLESWKAKADTLMSREQFQKAIPLYSKIIEAAKPSDFTRFDALYKRAVCYFSSNNYPLALTDVNTFIAQYPDVEQARYLRALIYGELDDAVNERKAIEEVVALDPLNPQLLKWQATMLLDDGDYDLAIEKLTIVEGLVHDSETEMYLGVAHYYQEEYSAALQYFDAAIALDDQNLTAYSYAGSLCIDASLYKPALQYLNTALSLDPENSALQFYKGIALVELDKSDAGCPLLRKSFQHGMDDAAGYLKEYCYK